MLILILCLFSLLTFKKSRFHLKILSSSMTEEYFEQVILLLELLRTSKRILIESLKDLKSKSIVTIQTHITQEKLCSIMFLLSKNLLIHLIWLKAIWLITMDLRIWRSKIHTSSHFTFKATIDMCWTFKSPSSFAHQLTIWSNTCLSKTTLSSESTMFLKEKLHSLQWQFKVNLRMEELLIY